MQSMDMRFNMYDSLLEYGPEGVLGMALAESLEPNADGTQYTVKLKSGLVFHDGSPVNADAVVYSFERIMDPKNPGLAASQLRGLKPGGTKKIDDLTVQLQARPRRTSIFPEALADLQRRPSSPSATTPRAARASSAPARSCWPSPATSSRASSA